MLDRIAVALLSFILLAAGAAAGEAAGAAAGEAAGAAAGEAAGLTAGRNVVENGDFEAGHLEPWICNGCNGYLLPPTPDHSTAWYKAGERKTTWAGPKQWLTPNKVVAGKRYMFSFSGRQEGEGAIEVVWKLHIVGPTGDKYFIIYTGQLRNQWEAKIMAFNMPDSVKDATEIQLIMQTVSVLDNFEIDDVFLGEEDTSDWKAEANQRIEQLRKRDVSVEVAGDVEEKQITMEVHQVSQGFPFGTAVGDDLISSCLDFGVDSGYCSFVRNNFNILVSGYMMKWRHTEPQQGQIDTVDVDKSLIWAENNNIAFRGHALLWAKQQNQPDWVQPLEGQELINALNKRIDFAVEHFEGKVIHWDVNNEMIDHSFYLDKTGDPDIRVKMFQRAKALSPKTLLFVNDYNVILDLQGRFDKYILQIRELLDAGAPIDGIGFQGHIKNNMDADPLQIKLVLDRFWDEFGLPIWITEFDWSDGSGDPLGDHSRHAEQLDNFYRMAFSHQAVGGILMWGFWDQKNNRPDSCIVAGDDLVANEAGKAYMELYHQEWRTNLHLQPDSQDHEGNNMFKFRGFLGEYEVSVIAETEVLAKKRFNLEADMDLCIEVNGGEC